MKTDKVDLAFEEWWKIRWGKVAPENMMHKGKGYIAHEAWVAALQWLEEGAKTGDGEG